MTLSLIVPCYNESRSLPELIRRCEAIPDAVDAEVVIVDNGSSDGTAQVLDEHLHPGTGVRAIRVEKNQGYGFGILSGLRAARGDVLAWTHADLQTDPQDVLRGYDFFARHGPNVFVKGRRYGRPLADTAFTVGMSAFETVFLGAPLWDINAQPTMFSRAFFESWKQPPLDFSLDLYAYYMARREGLQVFRFPVHFGARMHGVSHWNVNWAAKRKFIRRTVEFSLQLKKDLKNASDRTSP